MIKEAMKEAGKHMQNALIALEDDLTVIRTGRASPGLVEKLSVEYYGVMTPLIQLATVGVPEPRQLLIRPFDPKTVKDIERAILASDLGLTPNNDGKSIRLNLPQPTEERRHELVRIVHARLEEARIQIRNVRRDTIKDMREFEKEKLISKDDLEFGEKDLQELTDRMIEEVDDIGSKKEKEVMEV